MEKGRNERVKNMCGFAGGGGGGGGGIFLTVLIILGRFGQTHKDEMSVYRTLRIYTGICQ